MPDRIKPDDIKPDDIESDDAEPDCIEPEDVEPDDVEPEDVEPDFSERCCTEPDCTVPDCVVADCASAKWPEKVAPHSASVEASRRARRKRGELRFMGRIEKASSMPNRTAIRSRLQLAVARSKRDALAPLATNSTKNEG